VVSQFAVGKSSVVIEAGQTSRLKRVRISEQVPAIITQPS
jgi:uncharacterized protein YggU (UPF0235/DUF167 family)